MSTYRLEIDDSVVTEQISNIINEIFNREISVKMSSTNQVISQAVKDLIYSRKDEIINKVVDRAVVEMVKKGIPKLLERSVENNE